MTLTATGRQTALDILSNQPQVLEDMHKVTKGAEVIQSANWESNRRNSISELAKGTISEA